MKEPQNRSGGCQPEPHVFSQGHLNVPVMPGRTWILPEVACLSCLVIFLLVSQVAADTTWNYKIVSDPELYGIYADISGDYLVYSGSTGDPMLADSQRVIQLYSLSSGEQVRLAASDPGSVLTGENIDGNYVVWFSELPLESTADTPNRIYLYSIAEKNQTTIRTATGAGWAKVSGEHVIWTESVNNSFESSIVLYDIRTGTTTPIPGIRTINGAGVGYNGDYILYSDAKTQDLLLYRTATGATTTVFTPSADNTIRENIFGTALGNNYVLYRKDVTVEASREHYSELCLHNLSTGKTTLISPITGNVVETLSKADKSAVFSPQSADETRLAWDVREGVSKYRIMVLDPASMTTSSFSPKTYVNFVQLDGRNMTWLGTNSLAGKGSIYLGTESGSPGLPTSTTPTRAPGFGLIITVSSLLAGIYLIGNMQKEMKR